MKGMKFFTLAFLALLSCRASAQTLHLINFSTMDEAISSDVDYERTTREISLVASYIDYRISFYDGLGEDCSRENLLTTLNSLVCEEDDIIVFYYSGHGGRSTQDKSRYPQFCLKYLGYQQDKWVPMHLVVDELKAKNARLTLILADCCNQAASGVSPKMASAMSYNAEPVSGDNQAIIENYKKLFLDCEGTIVATSSKEGQVSWPLIAKGGLFSYCFFEDALYSAYEGDIPPTWAEVKNKTILVTKMIAAQNGKTQEPDIDISEVKVVSHASSTSQLQSNIVAVDSEFSNELSVLLDDTHSLEWRLQQIDRLEVKFFSDDAKVATVGRNGSTIIEYESAHDFLNRITLSKFIKQVNIIKEARDASGKRNYIKVMEIRKG